MLFSFILAIACILGILRKIQSIVQKHPRDRIPSCESSAQQGLYDLRWRRDNFKGENPNDVARITKASFAITDWRSLEISANSAGVSTMGNSFRSEKGNLSRLRGIAKSVNRLSDEDITTDYVNYLTTSPTKLTKVKYDGSR